jgi:tetratricopeptide (TPR) repeat protein
VRRATTLLLLLAAVGSLPATGRAEGIKWHKTLDEALQASKESGKLVMLTVYTAWCGYCDMLKSKTWPDEAVIAKSAEFESAAVDPEKTKLQGPYDNGQYPRTLFLRFDSEVVHEVPEYVPPEVLVREMARAQENLGKLNRAEEIARKLARPEDDLPSAVRVGILYAEIGNAKKAIEWLKLPYEGRDQLGEEQRPDVLVAYGVSLSVDLQYEKAVPVLREVAEQYANHPRSREARFALAGALLKTGKPSEARDIWKKLAEEKADDWIGEASAHNAKVADEMLGNP